MSKKTVSLLCTSAFMVAGNMITPEEVVHGVPMADAKSLIARGKAKQVEPEEEADGESKPLADMTVAELKAEAKELEIEGSDGMKKPELIAAIEAAEADGEEEGGK